MAEKATVRVRFAPSPTGPLHIGGVRTALYNYLFARKNRGRFILRIEDTDRKRYVDWAESYIHKALSWCGINADEGPETGGDAGPYRQSERGGIYRKFIEKLIESGHAYYAFDTPEELAACRKAAEQQAKVWQYDATTRAGMRNTLGMSAQDAKDACSGEQHCVVRFKIDPGELVVFDDLIRGEVRVNAATLDDKVIVKSNGMPTYHLANIVDDHLMSITHVIRGEEWLPSAPLHILLYKSLGWESPQFAHLPLILKPSGKGKLSKRDGDQMGFPVFPLLWKDEDGNAVSGYREAGYLPEAVVNMLALLGWHPGDEKELFSLDELADNFSVEGIHKSGARFDPEKALWFNSRYLQKLPGKELAGLVNDQLRSRGFTTLDDEKALCVAEMMRPRIQLIPDLVDKAMFLFREPACYNEKTVRKRWKGWAPSFLEQFAAEINAAPDFNPAFLEALTGRMCASEERGKGAVMNILRLVLTGGSTGPGLTDIMVFLGKTEVLHRIENAISRLPAGSDQ